MPASGEPRIAPQAESAPQITPPAQRNFFDPDQRNCDADDAAGVHGGNSIAAECCHRQNQNHRRGTAVCGTQRDLSGRTDAGKDSVHKVGGTAGEGGSHGVADHLRTAGVEQQGNDNAGKKRHTVPVLHAMPAEVLAGVSSPAGRRPPPMQIAGGRLSSMVLEMR